MLAFPTAMGLSDHAVSRFLNANPVLLALVAGLFPGLFEETGRLVAFNTVLKKRKNRETSISYGIGHGGFEVILILGITYIQYIAYAVMINTGTFGTLVEQVAVQAPEQADTAKALADTIAAFSFSDIGIAFVERVFAVLFHIGASILVFYACKDKNISGCILLRSSFIPEWILSVDCTSLMLSACLRGCWRVLFLYSDWRYFSDHTCCFIRRTSEF